MALNLNNLEKAARDFDFSSIMEILKIIGISLSVIFGILFAWTVAKMRRKLGAKVVELKTEANPPTPGESKYDAKWKEIAEHLQSVRETEWKFAVIEADNIVEEILTGAGYPGDTLGEKLKQIDKNQLASINDIWEAHKLRNVIVHNPDYQVRYNDARVAISQYGKALHELGVLG
ncbi:MAG: hypothetical protein ABIG73_00045 [Patescibacteria group bacterium]